MLKIKINVYKLIFSFIRTCSNLTLRTHKSTKFDSTPIENSTILDSFHLLQFDSAEKKMYKNYRNLTEGSTTNREFMTLAFTFSLRDLFELQDRADAISSPHNRFEDSGLRKRRSHINSHPTGFSSLLARNLDEAGFLFHNSVRTDIGLD